MRCLDENQLSEFVYGVVAEEDERRRIDGHLAGCRACRRLVSALASAFSFADGTGSNDEGAELTDGVGSDGSVSVGLGARQRYDVLEWLGSGAMGNVYKAHDKILDRRVAIKTLRGVGAASEAGLRRRLRREAQVMSALRHHNIAQVYDVVIVPGQPVAVVMELIDGLSMRGWLAHGRRSVPEILVVFSQAARALHAAHEAGVVHRDFKPDNCMVSSDGRVRIIDFGLAVGVDARRVHRAGTLAYMAPEQRAGLPPDPRADQYSWCVALCEALTEVRPSPHEEICVDDLEFPRGTPRSVVQVLRRGLQPSARHRFSSMRELVRALGQGSLSHRRWGVPVLITALGVGLLLGWPVPPSRSTGCQDPEKTLLGLWTFERRSQVRRHLSVAGDATQERVAETIAGALDVYANAWSVAYASACQVGAEQAFGERRFDATMRCLRTRRQEFEGLLRALEATEPTMARRARDISGQLTPPAACRDPRTAVGGVPAAAVSQAELDDIAAERTRVRSLRWFGHYAQALEVARATVGRARKLGDDPLLLAALNDLAWLQETLDDTRALKVAQEAWALAYSIHDDRQLVMAAVTLAASFVTESVDLARAQYWQRHARAFADRAGLAREDALEIRLRTVEADLLVLGDEPSLALERVQEVCDDGAASESREQALARFDACMTAFSASLDLELPDTARATVRRLERLAGDELRGNIATKAMLLNVQAAVLGSALEFPEAQIKLEAALALTRRAYGSEYTGVATALSNIGGAIAEQGDIEGGIVLVRQSIRLRERLGSASLATALNYSTLAEMQSRSAEFEQARASARRALHIAQGALGSDSPILAQFWGSLARTLSRVGRHDRARDAADQALALLRGEGGSVPKKLASARHTRALVESVAGGKEALRLLQLAVRANEDAFGAEDFRMRGPLWNLALAQHAAGRLDEAVASFKHVVALYDGGQNYDDGMLAAAHAKIAKIRQLGRRRRTLVNAEEGRKRPGPQATTGLGGS